MLGNPLVTFALVSSFLWSGCVHAFSFCELALDVLDRFSNQPVRAGVNRFTYATKGDVAVLELKRMNDRMEGRKGSLQAMMDEGYFRPDSKAVFQMRAGREDFEQPVPFQIVRLPYAQTGMYLPKGLPLDGTATLGGYDGYIILLPGVGTDQSNATTLFNLGQTLMEGKNPALNVGAAGESKKLRLLPVLLDATQNGLGAGSYTEFGSPEGALAIVRNAHNVMRTLFPGAKAHLGGRSHGGTLAAEYSERFPGVSSCIILNPTPTDYQMHDLAWRTSEQNAHHVRIGGNSVQLNRTWDIYKYHGSDFTWLGTDSLTQFLHALFFGKAIQVPRLVLLGKNDASYPQPQYVEYIQAVLGSASSTEIRVYDFPAETSHDLWSRRDKQQFRQVVNDMAVFIHRQK